MPSLDNTPNETTTDNKAMVKATAKALAKQFVVTTVFVVGVHVAAKLVQKAMDKNETAE